MIDPYKIDGPTCYSFSTGRSSGYGLRKVLDANDPETLRKYLKVLTCNTGKEEGASLIFGDRVDREWLRPLGLSVTWLEYCQSFVPEDDESDDDIAQKFRVATYETLSRNGEPFEAIIRQRGGVLPNPRSRYCSSEMKTRTMHRYLRSIGWTEWETMIGVRADEQRRVAKFRFNPHPETKDEYVRIPLADALVTAHDVGAFWKAQPFDLELPNMNGKTMHGNCDLCFLKPAHQVFSLIAEKPTRAFWWAAQEKKAEAVATGNGDKFRDDRASYAQMAKFAEEQHDMFDRDEEAIACFCGD